MKNELRKISLQKRKELNVEKLSEKVLNNLFSLNEYKNAKNILAYYPLKYEIQTQKCFEDTCKNWYLPRVKDDNLEVCPYDITSLTCGNFKIQEPTNENIQNLDIIDAVIIPAVGADKHGYRIGYGKGFYDRFLKKLNSKCKKIILVYSECLYENVFPNEFDVKADVVVTDKEIFRF